MTTPKTNWLATRVNTPLYQVAATIAHQDGCNLSEVLRRLVIVEGERRGLWPPRPSKQEDPSGKHNRVL